MDRNVTLVLLKNLISRIETDGDGNKRLAGILTAEEENAIRSALDILQTEPPTDSSKHSPSDHRRDPIPSKPEITLNFKALSATNEQRDLRLCLDFGTAMSKATLIRDGDDDHPEDVEVLKLGIPGDQEQISETMLVSSVYIDNEGLLWFGNRATERSLTEGDDGARQRLDNIKRRLSEDGWQQQVGGVFNPTDVSITYGDMVLAYLTFFTWAVNSCLRDLKYSPHLLRRFALPSFVGERQRRTIDRLRKLVGEAQILADTFGDKLCDGLRLESFMLAVDELRRKPCDYGFVDKGVTEPLGVAGSMMSWNLETDNLIMVVDVGAGTSDFGLYRVRVNPDGTSIGYEADGSLRVITEAGNYLDRVLVEFILKKANITSEHPRSQIIRGKLNLRNREYKETLFDNQSVDVFVDDPESQIDVLVELNEFLDLPPIRKFGDTLRKTLIEILENVDDAWLGWARARPERKLDLMLTGGGAQLPMVQDMAKGPLWINGLELRVERALATPKWLEHLDENIVMNYRRVAVSLGGARKRLLEPRQAKITGGDVTSPPDLDRY